VNPKLFYLIWVGAPITKLVYIYIGLNANMPINNEFQEINIIFIILSLLSISVSLALSKSMYTSERLYTNKIIKKFIRLDHYKSQEIKPIHIFFNLFTISNGFAETCALFGLVGYMTTGNRMFFFGLIILSIIGWLFNFPKLEDFKNNIENKLT